jgi:Ni/Co efflux regulator RcnB
VNRFAKLAACSAISVVLLAGPAFAQDDHHDNHAYVKHDEWKKGYHLKKDDWGRGDKIDYRTYHLNAPPSGYEWRLIDGNYVMANINTGVISTTIVAH